MKTFTASALLRQNEDYWKSPQVIARLSKVEKARQKIAHQLLAPILKRAKQLTRESKIR